MKLVMEVELGRGSAKPQSAAEVMESFKKSLIEGLRDHPDTLTIMLMTDLEPGMGGPMLDAHGNPCGGKWEVVAS